ncbi:unnamed protein product [Cuscuta epithymum]|uniref:Uncharacterized protein n=1 Tax=Cuscuta epithymum TaxID=186058 RepID=A0AAV0FJQ3_9ASTE|nr:unnamed protein product [Cuscuta epithymum]
MDIEEVESNLHALRQLYGLLENDDEDGKPRVTTGTLDNKGRLLLKSLLDSATERLFKVHSQIIAHEVNASLQNSSLKVEGFAKPASEAPNFIFSTCEPENRKKRCKICQRPKTVKHFKPPTYRKVKFSDHACQSSIKVTSAQDKPSNQISHFWQDSDQEEDEGFSLHNNICFSSGNYERENTVNGLSHIEPIASSTTTRTEPEFVRNQGSHEHEIEEKNDFSKKVSEAIRQIELRIPTTLQLDSNSESGNTAGDKFLQMDLPGAIRQTKGLLPSFANELNRPEHDLANRTIPDSNGFRLLQGQKKTTVQANSLSASSSAIRNQDQDSLPLNSYTQKTRYPKSTTQLKENKNGLPLRHITTKVMHTWSDSKHAQLPQTRKPYKDASRYENYGERRYLIQEPEAETSRSSYSSWLSKQNQHGRSTYDGSHTEEEDYLVSHSDQSYTNASSISSDAGQYLSRHITRNRYMNESSSVDNEVYPSSSSSSPSSGGCETSPHSFLDSCSSSYSPDSSSSNTSSPVRGDHKYTHSKNTKQKRVGRWERLKDKLGIIFHHHHHHHHHHNSNNIKKKDENVTTSYDITKHKTPSLLKHEGKKIPHPQRKHDVYEGEQAVQKVSKSVYGKSKSGSNFQTLVKGLKEARSLKKPKPPKHDRLPSMKRKHGNNRVVKASHWWQLLRHHGKFNKPPALLDPNSAEKKSKKKKKLMKEFSKMKW